MPTATIQDPVSQDEADIRELIAGIHHAHHDKDAAAIAAPYAPDAAVFNLAPRLLHRGVDAQEEQAWLDSCEGPIDCASRDLENMR
ncbi:MAG: hypothetical protein P4L56_31440 [Candidatus Sulfopaludibacter sp.]|nr:hypothetical protein [Candidatus Sulfopaludibacter sp.]